MRRNVLLLVGSLLFSGCATFSGGKEQFFVCSYDTVWEASLESVKDLPVQTKDKGKGTIETGWIEIEGKERSYGIFSREGFGNRERARMTLVVKKMDDVTSVSALEMRQRWHLKGGVTQQATKWWPIDPSPQAEEALMGRVRKKLQEKGCAGT